MEHEHQDRERDRQIRTSSNGGVYIFAEKCKKTGALRGLQNVKGRDWVVGEWGDGVCNSHLLGSLGRHGRERERERQRE